MAFFMGLAALKGVEDTSFAPSFALALAASLQCWTTLSSNYGFSWLCRQCGVAVAVSLQKQSLWAPASASTTWL